MLDNKKVTAIILVAGNSTRYGQNRNKNFEIINGKTILEYSLDAFDKNSYVDNIVIGAKESEIPQIEKIVEKGNYKNNVKVVLGGDTRKDTVYNCIKNTNSDIVIIHDGARPAIKQGYINNCIESMGDFKGVTIGVKSKDTIKITNENNVVINTTQRSNTWQIQTPQCFNRNVLLEAHENNTGDDITDDCMLLEKENCEVKILEGDYTNIKITTYEDLDIMKGFLI